MGARASLWALVQPGVSKLVENDVSHCKFRLQGVLLKAVKGHHPEEATP